jgi:predicted lipoprotein with Yx(FWY)xxD motif
MRKLLTPSLAAVAVLGLAACGSSSSNDGSASTPAPAPARAGGGATIAVEDVAGVGKVLVDRKGMAVYTPDEEASGKIVCTGSCTGDWIPVTAAGSSKPSAEGDAGKLGVITRPGGAKQVTANGRPLYTFVEDSPGKATGNGFEDDFAGKHFTWRAVAAGGRPASASDGGGGAGNTSGGGYSNGGY